MNISCQSCYESQHWDGSLKDCKCKKCGEKIPVESIASNLVHIFCGPAYFGMPRPRGMYLFNICKALSELDWGDACVVGRHDWVIAGCPVTIDDFVNGLGTLGGVELAAISRLMGTKPFIKLFSSHNDQICGAIQARLSGDIVRIPRIDFERLVRTIGDFPTVGIMDFLKKTRENYLDEFIQYVVNEVIRKCEEQP